MRLLIFSFAVLLSLSSFAKNSVVYFGGDTSADEMSRRFDTGLQNLMEYSKDAGWNGDYYYRKDTSNLKEDNKDKTQEFNRSNYIQELNKKLQETAPGEQLLVVIAGTGQARDGKVYVNSDSGAISLQELKAFIKQAEAKGIKLGVVSGVSYSGGLTKLGGRNTCIITDSQPDKVGVAGDSSKILKKLKLKKTENLEDLYLESRRAGADKEYGTQPMISTKAGEATDNMLYALKPSIFRRYDIPNALKVPTCINTDLAVEALQESIDNNSNLSISAVDSDEKLSYSVKEKLSYSTLKEKTHQFNVQYAEMKDLTDLHNAQLCTPYQGQPVCVVTKDVYRIQGDIDKGTAVPAETKKIIEELTKDPRYADYKTLLPKWEKSLEELDEKGREVSNTERYLYDRIYKNFSKDLKFSSEPNPCRDFKL